MHFVTIIPANSGRYACILLVLCPRISDGMASCYCHSPRKFRAVLLHVDAIMPASSGQYDCILLSLSPRVPGGMAVFYCHYAREFRAVWLHFFVIIPASTDKFPRQRCTPELRFYDAGGLLHFKEDHKAYGIQPEDYDAMPLFVASSENRLLNQFFLYVLVDLIEDSDGSGAGVALALPTLARQTVPVPSDDEYSSTLITTDLERRSGGATLTRTTIRRGRHPWPWRSCQMRAVCRIHAIHDFSPLPASTKLSCTKSLPIEIIYPK